MNKSEIRMQMKFAENLEKLYQLKFPIHRQSQYSSQDIAGIWQYQFWSFNSGNTKLETKNQHTQFLQLAITPILKIQ